MSSIEGTFVDEFLFNCIYLIIYICLMPSLFLYHHQLNNSFAAFTLTLSIDGSGSAAAAEDVPNPFNKHPKK